MNGELESLDVKAYLSPSDTLALEEAALCLRDKLLIRLYRRLGARCREVFQLEVSDVDFNYGCLTIEHLKSRVKLSCPQCKKRLAKDDILCSKCGWRVDDTVKKKKTEETKCRTLPIDHETLDMIKAYIERGGPEKVGNKTLLFNISRSTAYRVVREAAERAGLPLIINRKKKIDDRFIVKHVSPHRLRDAYATQAYKVDPNNIKALQEHLGHARITTTMEYVKQEGSEQRDWSEKVLAATLKAEHKPVKVLSVERPAVKQLGSGE